MSADTTTLQAVKQDADALRPRTFEDFIGQEKVKENLQIMIAAAKLRHEVLGDLIICGPAGTGKVTLSLLVANAVGVIPIIRNARKLKEPDVLANILVNVQPKGVLVIEDIDQLSPPLQALLCGVVEEDILDVMIGKGQRARSKRLIGSRRLPPLTVIGTADSSTPASISSTLRERFDEIIRLAPYSPKEVEAILLRASNILRINLDQDRVQKIAQNSGGIPHDAIRLLKRHATKHKRGEMAGSLSR